MVVQEVIFDPTIFQGMITNFSKSITYTPVTKVVNNITGDENLIEGTSTTIIGTIFFKKNTYTQGKEGIVNDGDATFIGYPTQFLNRNDILAFGGTRYRVNNYTLRYLDQTPIYSQADLFVIVPGN